jgi:outer membrane protein TolC
MDFQIEKFELSDDQMLIGEAMVEMPIFTWNKISNYRHMAERGIEVQEIKLKALHDRLRFDVVSAYKTAVLAKEARRTLLEVIGEMELFSETANQDFEDGASNAPHKDILQVQYDLNDMKTWLPELDKWETLSIEALKISIGEDRVTPIAIVGDTLEYPQVQFDLDSLVGKALENRAEIRMLEKAMEVSELQKNVAKVSNLPMFGVFGKYTHTEDDFDPNQENTWVVGVGATMALFDGMKSYGMYKEADANRIVLKNQLDQAKKGISLQVQEALTEVNEYYEQLKLRELSRDKAIEQVNVVRQGYQFGITTVDDVNDSQVQKRWADAHYFFKKLEYVTSIAKLNRAVGMDVHLFN